MAKGFLLNVPREINLKLAFLKLIFEQSNGRKININLTFLRTGM